jgi:hypothetical protein
MMSDLEKSFEESASKTYTLIIKARAPELLTYRENILIYMVGCYFYYILDKNIMSDKLFDGVCLYLKENLGKIPETEWFRSYLDTDALSAKTGYQIKTYPQFIVIACNLLNKSKRVWNF